MFIGLCLTLGLGVTLAQAEGRGGGGHRGQKGARPQASASTTSKPTSPAPSGEIIWAEKPKAEDWQRLYPAKAKAAGQVGAVKLSCTASKTGTLDPCLILEEYPLGQGFGEAALQLAKLYHLAPRRAGDQFEDLGDIQLPLIWRASAEPPLWPIADGRHGVMMTVLEAGQKGGDPVPGGRLHACPQGLGEARFCQFRPIEVVRGPKDLVFDQLRPLMPKTGDATLVCRIGEQGGLSDCSVSPLSVNDRLAAALLDVAYLYQVSSESLPPHAYVLIGFDWARFQDKPRPSSVGPKS